MEKFKIIKEESFESVAKYLNVVYKLTQFEYPLAFVDTDKRRYMVTKIYDVFDDIDDGFLVAYEEDGEIKPIGVFYQEENVLINMDEYSYRIGENCVARENMINQFNQQLKCTEPTEEQQRKNIWYRQHDPLNKRTLNMHYMIGGHKDPKIVLPYLNIKKPYIIELVSRFLLFEHAKTYVQDREDYRPVKKVTNSILATSSLSKKVPQSEVFDMVEKNGFQSYVDNDLIDIYLGNNERINEIQDAAKIYRKNTHL